MAEQNKSLTFSSNLEAAKPSQVIMQILTEKMRGKRLAVIDPDIGFMANQDVFNDIDEFVQRYCDNGGSTMPIGKNENIKQNADGIVSPVDPSKSSAYTTDTSASANASPVEHKHKAPPTPTIEEQLDTILEYFQYECWKDGVDGESMHHSDYDLEKAKEGLTLLITKAEQTGAEKLGNALKQVDWQLDNSISANDTVHEQINYELAQLKAPKTDQEGNEV